MNQLQHLNTMQKDDYFEEIVAYDSRVQNFVEQTHAKVLREHLENTDLQEEIKHMKFIWKETKTRFNKLMQEKIMEMGYNPRFNDLGGKSYQLDPSYLHKP